MFIRGCNSFSWTSSWVSRGYKGDMKFRARVRAWLFVLAPVIPRLDPVFVQEPGEGAAVFLSGFRRARDISVMREQQALQVRAFELRDGLRLHLTERSAPNRRGIIRKQNIVMIDDGTF